MGQHLSGQEAQEGRPIAKTKVAAPVERESVSIGIRLIPYFGIKFDHPRLRGVTAVGETPEKALINARGAIANYFPAKQYDVTVEEENPDVFARAGVHFHTD